jgi:hypothetical protein
VRRLAFACLAVAMVSAALLLGSRHEQSARSAARVTSVRAAGATPAASGRSTSGRRRSARSFIGAFLTYEAGRVDGVTRAAIRRHAAPRLAWMLLARSREMSPGRAEDRPLSFSVRVDRLPHRPDLALVTGTARRVGGPEPFAFLFARRGDRWLAIAPAE